MACRRALLAPVTALTLIVGLAACGGDDDSDAAAPVSTAAPAVTTAPPAEPDTTAAPPAPAAPDTTAPPANTAPPATELDADAAEDPVLLDRVVEAAAEIDEELVPADLLSAAQECWDEANELAAAVGVRNSQASVLAPTGTIGLMMDCDTTGIEPDLGLVKTKKLVGGGTMSIVNQTVPRALRNLGYDDGAIDAIVAYIDDNKSILGAPHLARLFGPSARRAFGRRGSGRPGATGTSARQGCPHVMLPRRPGDGAGEGGHEEREEGEAHLHGQELAEGGAIVTERHHLADGADRVQNPGDGSPSDVADSLQRLGVAGTPCQLLGRHDQGRCRADGRRMESSSHAPHSKHGEHQRDGKFAACGSKHQYQTDCGNKQVRPYHGRFPAHPVHQRPGNHSQYGAG